MENKEEKGTFNYTYSAKEQEELKAIRKKYLPEEKSKLEQLRQLDMSVTKKGTMLSIIVGVIGALLMGIGMSCAMVWMGVWFIPGIIIGVAGIGVIALAYPIYNSVTKKEREKIAPEIIKLTDELMK